MLGKRRGKRVKRGEEVRGIIGGKGKRKIEAILRLTNIIFPLIPIMRSMWHRTIIIIRNKYLKNNSPRNLMSFKILILK